MKVIKTISNTNLIFQIMMTIFCCICFLFISIEIFNIFPFRSILLALISVVFLVFTIWNGWNKVYKLEFGEKLILRTFHNKFEIYYYEITNISQNKLICNKFKISFWYPVHGKYGIGSAIDNYSEILTLLKNKNKNIKEIIPETLSIRHIIPAAIISIFTTFILVFTGLLDFINDSRYPYKYLFGFYFLNVIILGLVFFFYEKYSIKKKVIEKENKRRGRKR